MINFGSTRTHFPWIPRYGDLSKLDESTGDIQWNLREQTFGFRVVDKRILWCSIDRPSPLAFRSLEARPGDLLLELLQAFEGLFREPHDLPPQKATEHRIRLKPGTDVVAVRRYRYAHLQKDKLERHCGDLL